LKVKRILWGIGTLAAVGVVVAVANALESGSPVASRRAPMARVTRGTFRPDVWTAGELKATRVVSLAAPSAGGGLRLIRLVETGTPVEAGDVVMEFDPAEQQFALEQALTELAEAEQTVIQRKADIEARTAQDEVALLNARYLVRRAELDMRMPERLLPANDVKKRALTLEEMKRRLAQTEHDMVSQRKTREAALAVVEEGRNRSQINADRAKGIIESLVVRAPISGLVLVKENRDATGGVFFSGMSLPEFRAGDTVAPGRSILDVSDPADMEITARVNEQERTTLVVGQAATVRADALPGVPLAARITALSGVALRSREQAGPLRQFEVVLRLDAADARLRPGTTVRVTIAGKEVSNVLTVPRQAVFQQDGRSIVYLRTFDGYEPKTVKVVGQSESRTAIEGIDEGAEIALVSPTAAAKSETKPAGATPGPTAAAPSGGGGGGGGGGAAGGGGGGRTSGGGGRR
jgi:multidrug resistance efflux pump